MRAISAGGSETESVPCTFRVCHVQRSRLSNRYVHVGQTVNAATHACVDKLCVEKSANLLHPAHIVNEAEKRADVDPYVEREHGGATRENGTLLPSGKRSHIVGTRVWRWYNIQNDQKRISIPVVAYILTRPVGDRSTKDEYLFGPT